MREGRDSAAPQLISMPYGARYGGCAEILRGPDEQAYFAYRELVCGKTFSLIFDPTFAGDGKSQFPLLFSKILLR